ncbi:MAG: hypothetical protein QE278_14270 [Limnobacter sp.]|nr:hypothetical protein [Limnobacter sp.]
MGACNPVEAIGACGGAAKGGGGACGPAAGGGGHGGGGGGGACGVGGAGGGGHGGGGGGGGIPAGGGAPVYNPMGVNTPLGMGGPDWGDTIQAYINPDDPTPPTFIRDGNGQANGTGPFLDYYLNGSDQERYPLIYDLTDPAVVDMLGGPERWSERELTALGHSARHKPEEKQRLFFEAVADMVASPEPLSLNDFYNLLMDRGYANMSPEYRTTEVTAWWVWSQQGDAYALPKG